MTRNQYRFFTLPLLPFVVSIVAGAFSGGLENSLYQILVFISYIIIIWAGFYIQWIRLPRKAFLALLGCFIVAFLSVHALLHPVFPKNHITNFESWSRSIVEGRILAPLDPGIERTHLTVETDAVIANSQRRSPAYGRMRVTVYGRYSQTVFVGDRVRFVGAVLPVRPPYNPFTFDYRRFLALKRIYAATNLNRFNNLVVIENGYKKSWFGLVDRIRQRLNRWISKSVSEPYNALVSAMLIGYRGWIPTPVREIFRQCGTSHLVAISGLHLGIVAVFIFIAIKRFLGLFPGIFLYMDVQRITAVLTFFFLLFYLFLTGCRISTIRAFIMAATFLAVLFFRRTARLEGILLIAAFVILLFQPQAVFDSSFQLTFVAVGGILLGVSNRTRQFRNQDERRGIFGKGIRWLGMTFWITFLAMAATFPIIGYHFHRVSPMGILANIFGVPFVSFLVLPVGITALSIFLFSTTIATYLIKLDGRFVEVMVDVFRYLSHTQFSQIYVCPLRWYEIVLYYAAFVFALLTLRSHVYRERLKYGALALIFASLLCVSVVLLWLGNAPSLEIFSVRGGTYLAMCDKKGHATLVCNGLGDSQKRDDAKWVLIPYLLNRRVRKIDTIVVANNQPVNLRAVASLLLFKVPDRLVGTPSTLNSLKMILPSNVPKWKWLSHRDRIRIDPLEIRLHRELPPYLPADFHDLSPKKELSGVMVSYKSVKVYVSLKGRTVLPFKMGDRFNLLVTANPENVLSRIPSLNENLWVVRYPKGRRWRRRLNLGSHFLDLRSDGAVEITQSKEGWRLRTFLSRKIVTINPSRNF